MTSGHFSALLFFCLQFLSPKRRDVSGMAPAPLQRLVLRGERLTFGVFPPPPSEKAGMEQPLWGGSYRHDHFIRVTVLSFRLTCNSVHQTISVAERNVLEKFHQLTVVLGCSPRCSSPRGGHRQPSISQET